MNHRFTNIVLFLVAIALVAMVWTFGGCSSDRDVSAAAMNGHDSHDIADADEDEDDDDDDKDDDEEEVALKFADLPGAVQNAARNLTPESAVKEVSMETERGVKLYEVVYNKNGDVWEAEFDASGKLLENELSDD